ncbi:MAG: DUF2256 domain-containing protein [Algiphilus sp.]
MKQANARRRRPPKAEKICVVCQRPFEWRRKWADVWEEVRYCSERCRRQRRSARP